MTSSPFAKTNILFVNPESSDLPAGRIAKLLIGFKNNGSSAFLVETIDGSFRYPQDFSYYIQNFSTYHFNKLIEPDREATFEYVFTPSETFSLRQFGLTINLRYKSLVSSCFLFSGKLTTFLFILLIFLIFFRMENHLSTPFSTIPSMWLSPMRV